jgi:hypothetical protein
VTEQLTPVRLYKYQVPVPANQDAAYWCFETEWRGKERADFPQYDPFVSLCPGGELWLRSGYSWDGATLFPDFPWIVVPSLVHDAGYQLIREGALPRSARAAFDATLRKDCVAQGAPRRWAWLVWLGVRVFGGLFV